MAPRVDPPAGSWGERLRSFRDERGLTQETLSALTGLRQGHISKLERGESLPTLGTRYLIASKLGVDVDELFPEPAQ